MKVVICKVCGFRVPEMAPFDSRVMYYDEVDDGSGILWCLDYLEYRHVRRPPMTEEERQIQYRFKYAKDRDRRIENARQWRKKNPDRSRVLNGKACKRYKAKNKLAFQLYWSIRGYAIREGLWK